MKLQSVAIVGAGAIGSYLIWGLSGKKDISLCVTAVGERKERYEQQGFVINGKTYYPQVKTPEEAHGVDLVIAAVKYDALDQAIEDIAKIVAEHTMVISLMNGVDSEERIAAKIGEAHVLPAFIMVQSERKGNEVRFNGETCIGMIYGEKDPSIKERTDALNELFADTPLHYRTSDVILSEIWRKYWLNIGNNLVQAVLGTGAGVYTDSAYAEKLRRLLRSEVEAVASAKGIDLSLADSRTAGGNKVRKTARYSTLQDLDACRHTEIEMFSGTLCRMGKELRVPTPYNETIYCLIKALEEKNDGHFDYRE